jgi:hypothetical protein
MQNVEMFQKLHLGPSFHWKEKNPNRPLDGGG